MNADWRNRYEVAVAAAQKGGDLANSYFDGTYEVEIKADQSPVTVADRGAEKLIREIVGKHFPEDGFLGEEFGDQPGTSGFRWIIDPIDGTKSFIRNIPIWATLIGLEYHGEQIAGVCYLPSVNHHMYRALRGDGAYRDDRRIRVSDVADLSDSLLCYSSISWFQKNDRESVFLDLVSKTTRQRGFGDFYGFVLVAQGSADLMVEHGVNPWDVAATKALVEEAGGMFTDWSGVPTIHTPDVVASNGKVHAAALNILNR
ncbi:inositol monophosphatase family protein [Fimbriiglobus ruber]|uniref:Histidinol-phosphatase [alternative form] n=1 Tax=Fimbriiglobus ruber TaxID=1908690 RepID=A0A225E890_9BACT|nr:inositol monophosphatase family protein [Fimbriiglobus ruber]OWK46988.1 Histidinol-phosphatase [alternative form] [Fimbriiglobus ruber]